MNQLNILHTSFPDKMYEKIFVKIIFQNKDQKRGFAVRARPHSTLKHIKSMIADKLRQAGILVYNSKLIGVSGMSPGQRVKDLDKKILKAYQVEKLLRIVFHLIFILTTRNILCLLK